VQAINLWVEQKTEDRIKDLLSEGTITSDTRAVLAFKKPLPMKADELQVDDALLRAWGDALAAVHDGDPVVAKQKVADVVKRWPAFTPAKERLGQL
jgi:hypothetical protein